MGAEQGGGIGAGNEALRAFCFVSHRGGWKWGRGGACLSSHCLCCCEMLGGARQGTAGWVLPVSLWCRGMEPRRSASPLARKMGEGEPKEKLQSFLNGVESSCMMLASPSPGASADLTGEDHALWSQLCLRHSFFSHPLGTSGHHLPPSTETPVLPGASSTASPAPPATVGHLQ